MPRTTSRSALRRERIARQFRQTHDDVTTIFSRRLTTLFRSLSGSILESLSRADSPAIPVDQLFDPNQWGPIFNSILKPSLRTAAVTGISFEKEWTESATGETTRQHIASVANYVRNATRDASFKGVLCTSDQKLQLIRESQNLLEFSTDFSSFKAQKSPQPSLPGFLPDIGVDMSAELLAETERFLKFRTVGVWSKVSATIRSQLQAAIQMGLRSGDSLPDLTKRIQSVLTLHSKYAAQRIARTETTAAMGFGGHAERLELGTPAKEWVSTVDKRNRGANPKSRFDHLTCSGQTVESANAFVISGEHLLYPGDITFGATGGNVIHCRCSAVGAWPKGQLAGAGWKPSGMPRAADPITPQGSIHPDSQNALNRANGFRLNDVVVKQLIKQTTDFLKASFDKTEAIREKIVTIHEDFLTARTTFKEASKRASDLEERIQTLKQQRAPAKEIKELTLRLKKLEKIQADADLDLAEKTRRVDKEVRSILKASNPAKINNVLKSSVKPDSVIASTAEKAADWVSEVLEESAVKTPAVSVNVDVAAAGRANYKNGTTYLSDGDGVRTGVHEIGHHLETLGNIGDAGLGFLLHRTQGYGPAKLLLSFNPRSKLNEVYWDDEFLAAFSGDKYRAAYTGKYYAGQVHTEIISMGLELLYANPTTFARSDPEFFRFIIGILMGLLS